MKRKPKRQDPVWNISFWVVVLWPLIVVATVSIGFVAAEVIEAL